MENSISNMNNHFNPLKKTISPLVDKLHVHLDVFPELAKDDQKLADSGFIVFNLCLNAQTLEYHTECDASYTMISVPNQLSKKTSTEKKNKGKFELNINEHCTMIIPLEVGTSFAYSGFLLTHRQQIYNESDEKPPFVNIVSYNSKRLFENMFESFRRFLGKKY